MIVVADRLGQLGNRLFQFAHVVAFGIEHGVRVANPGFQDYAADFPAFAGDALCRWPPARAPVASRWSEGTRRHTARLLALAERAGRPVGPVALVASKPGEPRLSDPAFVREARRRPTLLVTGWGLREEAAFAKHASTVRSAFAPAPERAAAARSAVDAAREGADVLVGLHMRRGDYARYAGGRYLWSVDEYANLAERARSLHPDRDVAVLACGDDPAALSELGSAVARGPGHPVEDLDALSRCDLIVGPPSTFSAWAAFHGRAPLRHLEAPGAPLALDDFRQPL